MGERCMGEQPSSRICFCLALEFTSDATSALKTAESLGAK